MFGFLTEYSGLRFAFFLLTGLNRETPAATTKPTGGVSKTGPTSPSASTPAPSATVDPAGYRGRPYQEVVQELGDLGYTDVTARPGDPADTTDPAKDPGDVYDVQPRGNVPLSEPVTVLYYAAAAKLEQPGTAVAQNVVQPVAAGSTFTISWDRYPCPAGQDTLAGYKPKGAGAASFTPRSGRFSDQTIQITAGGAGSGPITISYRAYCGARLSPASKTLTIQVAAAEVPASSPSPVEPSESAPVEPVEPTETTGSDGTG